MVLFLSVIIFFLIIDRYIYKSKTFKEIDILPQKGRKQITDLKKELFYEIHHENIENDCFDTKSR